MNKFVNFFYRPRNLFILGFVATFLLTLSEVLRGEYYNFMIFAESTRDFWAGLSPYGVEWGAARGLDVFLYTPVFSVLFAPFAFLPEWLGPFVWNLFNFSLFAAAIFYLPEKYTVQQKCRTFLYTFLILATTQLSMQYNVTVAYIFLFAYSLLERGKGAPAVLLIMISGLTKIYGIFQLGLLICYPKFWKNALYAVLFGVALLALPLLKLAPGELVPYYQTWWQTLSTHHDTRVFSSIFFVQPWLHQLQPCMREVQIATISLMAVLLCLNYKKFGSFAFRARTLGVLMAWVILFSDTAEKHTYVIAVLGYLLWYWNRAPKTLDKVLFWANFALLVVVPVDVLCPPPVMKLLCGTLWLNVWVFLFTWLRMVYSTFLHPFPPRRIALAEE